MTDPVSKILGFHTTHHLRGQSRLLYPVVEFAEVADVRPVVVDSVTN